jgi:hypothetical protein
MNKTDKKIACNICLISSYWVQFELLLWNRINNLESNVRTYLRDWLISNNVMPRYPNSIFLPDTRYSDDSLIFAPFQQTV